MKKRFITLLVVFLLVVSNMTSVFANDNLEEQMGVQEMDPEVQEVEPEVQEVAPEVQEVAPQLQEVASAARGDTIADTFPDANFAKVVADAVANGDVNAILTQGMIDNCTSISGFEKKIEDITGVEILTKIKRLELMSNQIKTLPDNIGNLSDLEIIILSNNQLTGLPESFGDLSKLKTLTLSMNRLINLPESFGNLGALESLDVSYNELANLPNSFVNLKDKALKRVSFKGNLFFSRYADDMKELGFKLVGMDSQALAYEKQSYITLSRTQTFEVKTEKDIENIDFASLIEINDHAYTNKISSLHTYSLESFYDENNQLIYDRDFSKTFFKDGLVFKAGTVTAKVRIIEAGIFPDKLSEVARAEQRITLKLTVPSFQLAFDLQGAASEGIPAQAKKVGEFADEVAEPTKVGHTFAGWNTKANGTGTPWYFETTTMKGSDMTLYAQWQANNYKVIFNANGGTGTMADESYIYNQTKALNKNLFTKVGYTFAGWSPTATATVSNVDEANYTFIDSKNATLYAQWKPNNYKVVFHPNGGTGTMVDESYEYEQTKKLNKNQFIKSGYTFAGWSTTATGVVTNVDEANYAFTTTGDVILYAQWTLNSYKVIFQANGGTGTMVDMGFDYNQKKALSKNTFVRTGYTFAGWSTTATGAVTNLDQADYTFNVVENVSLYAQWIPNSYKVIFNVNGGTGTMLDQVYNYDQKKALSKNLFTRVGHTFVGWSTTANGEITNGDEVEYTFKKTENVTLYAQWTSNNYNLVFAANGGKGTMLDQAYGINQKKTLSKNLFTRVGYTFAGWSTTTAGEIAYVDEAEYTFATATDVTLYAKWIDKAMQEELAFIGNKPLIKEYGSTDGNVKALGGSGSGKITYSVTSGEDFISVDSTTGKISIKKVGTAIITATKAEDANYLAKEVMITVNVTKKALTVTTTDQDITYGDEIPAKPGVSVTGFATGETQGNAVGYIAPTITYKQEGSAVVTPKKAGIYDLHLDGGMATNYSFTYDQSKKLTINKKDLLVKADNKKRNYGKENPIFTLTYTGFVNDETVSALAGIKPKGETLATPDSEEGNYDITVNTEGASDSNYNFIINATSKGTLTIADGKLNIIDDVGENDGIIVIYRTGNTGEKTAQYENGYPFTHDLKLTLNNEAMSQVQIEETTWKIEAAGGFSANNAATFIVKNGKVSVKKSGIVKVTATYNGDSVSIYVLVPGDINRDEKLNGLDISKLQFYKLDPSWSSINIVEDEFTPLLVDINGDKMFNGKDTAVVQSMNLNKIDPSN